MFGSNAVDVQAKGLLALDALGQRSSPNAPLFLRETLKMCVERSLVSVDRPRPWCPRALGRLGLDRAHERFGARSAVERFFRYLKDVESSVPLQLYARNHIQDIVNLEMFLVLFTLCYRLIGGEDLSGQHRIL